MAGRGSRRSKIFRSLHLRRISLSGIRLAAAMVAAAGALVAGCSSIPLSAGISLRAYPREVLDAPAGEPCLILVTVDESRPGRPRWDLTLTVEAPGAEATVFPLVLGANSVAEVLLVPPVSAVGSDIPVRVSGGLGVKPATASVRVTEPPEVPDALRRSAERILDGFGRWIEETVPEIDPASSADWQGIPIRLHRLVVSHYMFLSPEWEIVVWWHVTVPPHDWARIYVRKRFTDDRPRAAAEISSFLGGTSVVPIPSPPDVLR